MKSALKKITLALFWNAKLERGITINDKCSLISSAEDGSIEYLVLPVGIFQLNPFRAGTKMCVCVFTVVAGGVGLPVRRTEVSGFGGLHDDVLDVPPCQKGTRGRSAHKTGKNTFINLARSTNAEDDVVTDREYQEIRAGGHIYVTNA